MRKSFFGAVLCMLAVMTAAAFVFPQSTLASGTKKKPVADDVQYYYGADGKTKTGIKSITLNPFTYYNLSRDPVINPKKNGKQDPTLSLNKTTMQKIAETEIFPHWGTIAEGIFRDQANQLVTIEGSGMMKSDTSSAESFDRHFSYSKAGVNEKYKKYNWSLADLAESLGRPESKSGKKNAEQGGFSILKGSTNEDEVVYSGIYAISSLKDARTLAGKSLRACADDNDLTVDDFLGNGYDKSNSKYRLPDLDNSKTGPGFASIVTCVNQAGSSWDYDYNTFGIAVYDFDVTPIAAEKVKYIEAAQGYKDVEEAAQHGVKGVYFNSGGVGKNKYYLKNNSSEESTVTASLENSESEEMSSSTEDTFEWGMEQEIGAEFNTPAVAECIPYATFHVNHNWHETWSTMKGKTDTKSKTWTKNVSTELTLPAHTAAEVIQQSETTDEMEDYQQPVVINYKVAIFAMSGDYYNGSLGLGRISPSMYDKQWMSVLFDGSDGSEPGGCNALASLYSRAVENKDMNGYDGIHGKYKNWCDKGVWVSSDKIDWNNVASGISGDSRSSHFIEKKTGSGGKATLKDIASELSFAETANQLRRGVSTMSSDIDRIVALYDLESVSAECPHYDLDTNKNVKLYLDTIKLNATDKQGSDFYGFDSDWGSWELVEKNAKGIRLDEDSGSGVQWITATDAGQYHLKWKFNEDAKIYSNESPDGMENLGEIETPTVLINVKSAADSVADFTVSGEYTGDYSEAVNLNQILDVSAKDSSGTMLYMPVFWEATKGGKFVSENGDVKFPGPGTYKVRAYALKENGTKLYSNSVSIKAVGLKNIGFKKPDSVDEEALTLTAKHPSRSFDLTEFVSFYDQDGNIWKGDTSTAVNNMEFTVDDNENASIDYYTLTISKAGRYEVTCRTTLDDGTTISKTITLRVTKEDWLDHIEMDTPDMQTSALTLNEPGDEVCVSNLLSLLSYYDEEGNEWTGKKPTVKFSILPDTDNAQIRGSKESGYSFYAGAPGTYRIQPVASGYEIAPITVVVTEKAKPVAKRVNPPRLMLDDNTTTVSTNLDNCIYWSTQFDGTWKDPPTELKFELDENVKGAKIVTKPVKDRKTGQIRDENSIACTQEGEYAVHVKAKDETAYSDKIADIIVKVDRYKKVSALGLRDLGKDSKDELSVYEGKILKASLNSSVIYYDQNGAEIDSDADLVTLPSVEFEIFERQKDADTGEIKEVTPDREAAYIDDSDIENPMLVASKPGCYTIRVSAKGMKSVKPAEVNMTLADKTWNHEFEYEKNTDGSFKEYKWTVEKKPTCTEPGVRVLKASDGTQIKNEIPATGHHWGRKYELIKEPTKSEAGMIDIKCEKCGAEMASQGRSSDYQLSRIIPMRLINGTYENIIKDENGKKQYILYEKPEGWETKEIGINWPEEWKESNPWNSWPYIREATCLKDGTCVVFYSDTYQKVNKSPFFVRGLHFTGHHWDDKYTMIKKPTCTEEGTERIECTSDGCKSIKPGSTKAIPRLQHEYDSDKDGNIIYETKKEATCTEDGYKEAKCKNCSHVEREVIKATGHNWARPSYKWELDESTKIYSVTARRECTKNTSDKCVETETVKATAETTKFPSKEDKGETTYTAEFSNPAFTTQKRVEADIPRIGEDDSESTDAQIAALKAKKEAAKAELKEYKSDVAYKAPEKSAREDAVNVGINAIESAKEAGEEDIILTQTKAKIDKIKTAAEIDEFEEKRQNCISEVSAIDPAEITEDTAKQAEVQNAKEAAIEKLSSADTQKEEQLSEAMMPLLKVILAVIERDEIERIDSIINSIKVNAYVEIKGYKSKDDYREAEQAQLEKAVSDGEKAVDNALTNLKSGSTQKEIDAAVDAVNGAVAAAKAEIDSIKTKAQYENEDEAAVAQARTAAQSKLISNKVVAGYGDYYEEEQEEICKIVSEAVQAINKAKTVSEVNELLADAESRLSKLKTKLEIDKEEAKEFVNSFDAEGLGLTDQSKIDKLNAAKNTAISAIDAATTTDDVDDAYTHFVDELMEIAQVLGEYKEIMISELEEYADPEDYDESGKAALSEAIGNGKAAIKAAGLASEVDDAYDNATAAIDKIATKKDKLNTAKTDARNELAGWMDTHYSAYRDAEKNELWSIYWSAVCDIEDASTIDKVTSVKTVAIASMNDVITAEEFESRKTAAKNELDEYKASKGESNYEADDWAQIGTICTNGKQSADSADTVFDIGMAVRTAKNSMDAIQTRAQKDLAAAIIRDTAALKEYKATEFAENNDTYRDEEKKARLDIISKGTAKIEAAESADEVGSILTEAKEAIDDLKTAQQIADEEAAERDAQSLDDEKTAAKNTLRKYRNAADYRDAEKDELKNAITEGCDNIDAVQIGEGTLDGAKGEVSSELDKAEKKIDGIKTAAQYEDEEELSSAKKKAVKNLENYRDPAGYRDEERALLEAEVDKGRTAINAVALGEGGVSEAKAAVDKALDDAKSAIDDLNLKTDEEKSAEEQKEADKKAAAQAVTDMINALPAEPKASDEEKVKEARAAYDALTDDQKKLVSGDVFSKLTAAEAAVQKAKKEQKKQETNEFKDGVTAIAGGTTYKVKSASAKTVWIVKGANRAKVIIPAMVTVKGNKCKVTGISARAFAKTKARYLVIKTKYLTKKSVKGSLKGSKVKKIKVRVGNKKLNKKFKKRYKRIFRKKNSGRKIIIK